MAAMNVRAVANDDGTVDLYVDQGKTQVFTITLYEDEALTTPLDLTGYLARGQVRQKYTSEDASIVMECAVDADPTTGIIVCTIPAEDTADLYVGNKTAVWYYDVEYYIDGDPETVNVALKGKYYISPEVTKEIPT